MEIPGHEDSLESTHCRVAGGKGFSRLQKVEEVGGVIGAIEVLDEFTEIK